MHTAIHHVNNSLLITQENFVTFCPRPYSTLCNMCILTATNISYNIKALHLYMQKCVNKTTNNTFVSSEKCININKAFVYEMRYLRNLHLLQ